MFYIETITESDDLIQGHFFLSCFEASGNVLCQMKRCRHWEFFSPMLNKGQ